ncbi:endo alpha-1,4 polygalactosaminidase [Lysinibacillus telephonicus]|uniref:Glucanotransferase n=1 Tax=Lysinibacillus telephonicus TaxID=1714840 RepID=A0A431UVG0_9BACI|nr:endo alpha-1,4 polygalactosaminidase [Lysinibacillus telephonicus]RTQ95068.1 glucanotransferase [Lysinibacillus telephonicus]
MFKKTFLAFNLAFPLLLTQCYPTMGHVHNPLLDVNSYKIYYGEIDDSKAEQLSNYDMVVIEPHETTKEHVSEIKEAGTIALGYISIMELQTWDEEFVEKVKDSDYLLDDGERVYVEDWDTYLMDITNPHYQQLLLDEIEEEIIEKQFDGILLDTVGDIDDFYHDDEEMASYLRNGYVELLQSITDKHNELLLLQNWGFETLETSSKDYVDAIMWEDFDKNRLKTSKWGQDWIQYFQTLESEENIAVFTVTPDTKSFKYSKKYGFVPYKNSNSIYN